MQLGKRKRRKRNDIFPLNLSLTDSKDNRKDKGVTIKLDPDPGLDFLVLQIYIMIFIYLNT
jgi:hypothetical protein